MSELWTDQSPPDIKPESENLQLFLRNFVEAERRYVGVLEDGLLSYLIPLETKMKDRENIDCFLEEAFGSIRQLATVHRGYLARLALVADVVDWVELLGNIFAVIGDLYRSYISRLPFVTRRLKVFKLDILQDVHAFLSVPRDHLKYYTETFLDISSMNDRMGTETRNRLLTVQRMVVDLYNKAEVQLFQSVVGYEELSRIEWRTFVAAQSQGEASENVHI